MTTQRAIVLAACILVGGLFIFMFYSHSATKTAQAKIDECISLAEENYSLEWDSQCRAKELGDDCSLPSNLAVNLSEDLRASRGECIQRYNK
jgi:hypothetical protein